MHQPHCEGHDYKPYNYPTVLHHCTFLRHLTRVGQDSGIHIDTCTNLLWSALVNAGREQYLHHLTGHTTRVFLVRHLGTSRADVAYKSPDSSAHPIRSRWPGQWLQSGRCKWWQQGYRHGPDGYRRAHCTSCTSLNLPPTIARSQSFSTPRSPQEPRASRPRVCGAARCCGNHTAHEILCHHFQEASGVVFAVIEQTNASPQALWDEVHNSIALE